MSQYLLRDALLTFLKFQRIIIRLTLRRINNYETENQFESADSDVLDILRFSVNITKKNQANVSLSTTLSRQKATL